MLQAFTIESDEEVEQENLSDEEFGKNMSTAVKHAKKGKVFAFEFDDGMSVPKALSNKRPRGESTDDEDSSDDSEEDDDRKEKLKRTVPDAVKTMPRAEERALRAEEKMHKRNSNNAANNDLTPVGMDAETEANFFETVVDGAGHGASIRQDLMFSELNLSRPLLRGIDASGYVNPTPVQARVIPVALAGRDVCASAVTGSGKTAAFVLPFLERLLFRPKDTPAIRVLVVSPTRELATQTYEVFKRLSQFTDITCCLISGGKRDVRSQEATLRQRPDVVICTPGRIIDHLRNSQSVSIDELDVLVLDEVDRLLDLGFREEVEEVVKYCPETRQTLLFSATMTAGVEELSKLSLKRPVRIKTSVDNSSGASALAPRLIQEFVRIRREDEREAILAALVCRNFSKRSIVFFETKKAAHRFYTILVLLKIKAVEMHGDMPQTLRYSSLQSFREGHSDVLVATDVAARGLDIPLIQTVINAEMPRVASTYVHRVGRTARAGCGGRAVTVVSDARRKVMKEVLKGETALSSIDKAKAASSEQSGEGASPGVLSRTIPTGVITHYLSLIAGMESEIAQKISDDELNKKALDVEREVERAENMMLHQSEITSRPARTWYQTETEKKAIREAAKEQSELQVEVAKVGHEAATAAQKARQLSLQDDYRQEQAERQKNKEHKMSRKKRRRMEALRAMEEGTDGVPRSSIKMKKEELREKEHSKFVRPAGGLSTHLKESHKAGSKKVSRPIFAVGGLDKDMAEWSGSAKTGDVTKRDKKQKPEKEFTDFDPTKRLRKGGKVANKAFKSKGKHKRR